MALATSRGRRADRPRAVFLLCINGAGTRFIMPAPLRICVKYACYNGCKVFLTREPARTEQFSGRSAQARSAQGSILRRCASAQLDLSHRDSLTHGWARIAIRSSEVRAVSGAKSCFSQALKTPLVFLCHSFSRHRLPRKIACCADEGAVFVRQQQQ